MEGLPARAALRMSGMSVIGREVEPASRPNLHDGAHYLLAFARRALVEFRVHPARHALALERLPELLADGRILLMIRDRAAALAEIDGAIVHELLARPARLARALVVGAVPGADAQAFLADAEMLVEP